MSSQYPLHERTFAPCGRKRVACVLKQSIFTQKRLWFTVRTVTIESVCAHFPSILGVIYQSYCLSEVSHGDFFAILVDAVHYNQAFLQSGLWTSGFCCDDCPTHSLFWLLSVFFSTTCNVFILRACWKCLWWLRCIPSISLWLCSTDSSWCTEHREAQICRMCGLLQSKRTSCSLKCTLSKCTKGFTPHKWMYGSYHVNHRLLSFAFRS